MNVFVRSPLWVFQRLLGALILIYISAKMILAALIVLIWMGARLLWSLVQIWSKATRIGSRIWKTTSTTTRPTS
jgi:hypothetical protein